MAAQISATNARLDRDLHADSIVNILGHQDTHVTNGPDRRVIARLTALIELHHTPTEIDAVLLIPEQAMAVSPPDVTLEIL